jgi:hypothetical protein
MKKSPLKNFDITIQKGDQRKIEKVLIAPRKEGASNTRDLPPDSEST